MAGAREAIEGDTRHHHVWYRDLAVLCSASTFDLTNATTLTWAP